jgi:hypothetical protein
MQPTISLEMPVPSQGKLQISFQELSTKSANGFDIDNNKCIE